MTTHKGRDAKAAGGATAPPQGEQPAREPRERPRSSQKGDTAPSATPAAAKPDPPGWRCDQCGLLERSEALEGQPPEACPQCGCIDWNELAYAEDIRALEARAEKAEALLREWCETPFFESRPEWSRWQTEFKRRVVAALREKP